MKLFQPTKVEPISPATVVQVLGRAGRPGYSNVAYGFIIYYPDEAEIVKKALSGEYGTIRGIGDYLALALRLIYSGRDIDVWLKHAPPFVDRLGLAFALDMLVKLGLVRKEGGKYVLTPVGELCAKEYLPSTAFGFVILLSLPAYREELLRENANSRELAVAAAAGGLSYILSQLWTKEQEIDSKLMSVALSGGSVRTLKVDVPDYYTALNIVADYSGDLYDALRYDYDRWAKVSLEKLLEPDASLPYTIVLNPELFSSDQVAETLRKAGQVIRTGAELGVLPSEWGRLGEMLMRIMKAYRRFLRTSTKLAEEFARTILTKENLEKLPMLPPDVNFEALFLYMKSAGITDVEEGYRKYREALRGFKTRNSEKLRIRI